MDRLIQAVELPNARSVTARVEDFARVPAALGGGAGAYDAVTARAVGPLAVLVEYAAPLLRGGRRAGGVEGRAGCGRGGAPAPWPPAKVGMAVEEVLPVKPYPSSENRHLHVFRKVAPTPDRVSEARGDGAEAAAGLSERPH